MANGTTGVRPGHGASAVHAASGRGAVPGVRHEPARASTSRTRGWQCELGWALVEQADRAEQILVEISDDHSPRRSDLGLPDRLVQACAAALPVSGVGLVWMSGAGPGAMLAATSGAARVMEELQFVLGEGPCIDCSRLSRPVLMPDLARTGPGRWPEFSDGALSAGIRAIFALPLQVGRIPLGVLDLYRTTAGPLNQDDLAEALAYADAATTLLLDLHASMQPAELHHAFSRPMSARNEVHQATGMIAVQAGVTLVEALVLLRAHAFAIGRPVNDLAAEVIARDVNFYPQ